MPKVDKDTYEIWKQYESIAMHFNDLISKIRLQAIGGVGTISIVVGFFSKDISECSRWIILGFAFLMLIFVWVSIWLLDCLYYSRLLAGAVKAVIHIEKISKASEDVEELCMSQYIEDAVKGDTSKLTSDVNYKWKSRKGIILFYSIVLVALMLFSLICFVKHLLVAC